MNTTSPKVSVIIPNYNHSKYLEKRIKTVLDQTYQDFEIIYLDDASTDNSNEIFFEFSRDPRIQSHLNQTNSGIPFKQWNKGIRAARGQYIWIAESDDYADSHLLESLVQKLETSPHIGVAYCQSWEVDEEDNILSSCKHLTDELDPNRWANDFSNSGSAECRDYLIYRCTIPNASAVLFRREVYDSIDGAPENLRLCGDWLFWSRLLKVSDVAFVAKPLNYFRKASPKGARGLAGKDGKHIEERFKVIKEICSNHNIPRQVYLEALHIHTYYWMDFSISNGIPLSSQVANYKTVKDLDLGIDLVLFRQFFAAFGKYILRFFGLTLYAKKILNRDTA